MQCGSVGSFKNLTTTLDGKGVIAQRNNHKNVIEKIKIGRKQHQIKEHFSAVPNKDGIVVKYINFITEVSL
jgi:hypothetical protein